jgi:transcription-repair coupling factor (superfamily II helicase)
VLLVAETAGRRETLAAMFAEHGLKPAASRRSGRLCRRRCPPGARHWPAAGRLRAGWQLAFITETELFAGSPRAPGAKPQKKATFRQLAEGPHRAQGRRPGGARKPRHRPLSGPGAHGLGLGEQEFLELHYANDAKLFVPVAQLHVISRYSGADPESAPLHTLGSGQWEKAKRKAAEQARDTAAELLALYAARAARQGHAFAFKESDYEAFADGFGFEETPTRRRHRRRHRHDMKSGKPMDRLVCGDVGFGKTEVALRAAFCRRGRRQAGGRAVPDHPAREQHYQTFADRFADWPVKIAEISRFKTAKESARRCKELAEGKIDIIIGTHKLMARTSSSSASAWSSSTRNTASACARRKR